MDSETPTNEGEYLKLANDLKEQFDNHKKEAQLQQVILQNRIAHLVDINTLIEHKNLRLRRMCLCITEKYTNCLQPLE
jgi:hypothetical protein